MTAAKPDAQLSPGSNEPVAQPPMAWLTPGLSRLIIIVACLGIVAAWVYGGKIPGREGLVVVTAVVTWALSGASHKQGAEAGANGQGK